MSETLKKQVTSGISWRATVDIGEQVLQIVFTAILARILTKADFGMVATALIVNRFFQTITNVGFGGAIIRSTSVTPGQVSAIFYIQFAINTVLSLIIYFLSNPIALFFNEVKLTSIIEVTSWVIFLQTFQFPTILMQKNMDFKRFSLMEIGSLLTSNLIAISMALMGYGMWSLVFRLLIQRVIFSASTWYFTKWKPIKPDFHGIKPLMTFGFNMLGSNIVYYFSENMIAIITSKYLGKETMGSFNIAYNLAIVPSQKIKNVLTTVLTSGFAKIQLDPISFAKNNQKALLYISLLFIPLMFILSGLSENLIVFIYGLKWIDAGQLLLFLAFVGMMKGIAHLLRSAILAKGKANVVFISTILEIGASLPVMYIFVQDYGIYGLMIGYILGAAVSGFYTIYYYDQLFGENKFFYKTVSIPFLIGTVIFCALLSIQFLNFHFFIELTIQGVVAILMLILLIKLFYKSIFNEVLVKLKLKKVNV